ncbi:MAG: 50S ribosomal protein L6 [Candidatus Dadabacteria bacterium]|nr:50S ribosomal protein L6 [Candidatus Dadabacteria bacterium]
MSRIGTKPVIIPDGVTAMPRPGAIEIKGPKGSLKVPVPEGISAAVEDGAVVISRQREEKRIKSFHGLTRSLVNNSVIGVSEGFTKILRITGTGYKADIAGAGQLKLSLGYSHPVDFVLPSGVEANVGERGTLLSLHGIDKQLVGETAARIRRVRPPDSYKGKGVRYEGEKLKLKPGKAGASK